ncbi:TPA: hypothetical protein N0F65_001409 [Lagenidium giganteum]|uniref:Uncharacterized protein n=1 Tax=Lagenidium giganteum TaxID=4803 RepID=A0AAV2Z1B0_9STRA|nr:TPA: hypothetical protein N0F65_001409 [Lagenidium giganteum]
MPSRGLKARVVPELPTQHSKDATMALSKRRRDADNNQDEQDAKLQRTSSSGYVNKQRVLVFCSRGITTRYRHLLDDFRKLLPHHKKEVKLDAKDTLHVVNEIAEIKGCNTAVYLEARKRQDLYMWVSRIGVGPSVRFLVQNVHTMDELKMTGNALMGSRPLLTFDKAFEESAHLKLIKQLFTQVWGTPKGHPKSKPFIDRVMSFYYADGKIWCRNYQLADDAETKKLELAALHRGEDLVQLIEIGPRFVLTPIRIFDGSFGGQTLFQNPHYVSPNETRRDAKFVKRDRYVSRKTAEHQRNVRKEDRVLPDDQFADVQSAPYFPALDAADWSTRRLFSRFCQPGRLQLTTVAAAVATEQLTLRSSTAHGLGHSLTGSVMAMDTRMAELQQVILKKDLLILQLQRQLDIYASKFGALDPLELQDNDTPREAVPSRRPSSAANSPEKPASMPETVSTMGGSEGSPVNNSENEVAPAVKVDPVTAPEEGSQPNDDAKPANDADPPSSIEPRMDTTTKIDEEVPPPPPPEDAATKPASQFTRTESINSTGTVVACSTGKNVVLDYVEDSPAFRRQLEGFEESLSGLRGLLKEILAHTKEYEAAGMRFGDEETALAEEIAHRKYARALFTTSCPELGNLSAIFSEFHDTMTQIRSSRVSMLLSIEALLHHSIYKFAEQELKEASDLRKEVTRLADEYESQMGKLLGKPKQAGTSTPMPAPSQAQALQAVASPDSGSLLSSLGSAGSSAASVASSPQTVPNQSNGAKSLEKDVLQARLRFEMARFDLVRYLNRLDCQKKFLLIECFNSTLYAFLGHFHACHELIRSIEPALRKRQETLQKSKLDFEEDDKMWHLQREALEQRLRVDLEAEYGRANRSFDLPIEVISLDTQASRDSWMGSITKQGYLFVRNTMFPARSWKRRWFQIHSGKLYQNRGKHMDLALVCDLMLARVRESSSSNLPYCFEVIDSSQAKLLLQATSEADMIDWIEAARKSTESMLEKQSHRMTVHPEQQKFIQELTTNNPSCADCGQSPSEWVSINIGCFLCIECSGIHRSLGVHVSKVRSLTLDSWEMPLLTLLRDSLGNTVVNSVWEHTLPAGWTRPTPTTPRDDKAKFIKAKYSFHGFTEFSDMRPDELNAKFFDSAKQGEVKQLMWCIAHGTDVNSRKEHTQETALHLAASSGSTACCDYLVLNGASLVLADNNGRLPFDAAKAAGFEAIKLSLMQKMSLEQYQF